MTADGGYDAEAEHDRIRREQFDPVREEIARQPRGRGTARRQHRARSAGYQSTRSTGRTALGGSAPIISTRSISIVRDSAVIGTS